jgi:hypothetical protein
VAIAIAPPRATTVPVAVPKTGQMTELMARVAAHNVAAELFGGTKMAGTSLPVTCIADAGDTAFYLIADPLLPPRNKVVAKRGKWARYLKLTFERYCNHFQLAMLDIISPVLDMIYRHCTLAGKTRSMLKCAGVSWVVVN